MKNSRKTKLVHGVGINDVDYPVTINAVVGGRRKQLWVCPFYLAWRAMLARCYSEKFQARCPTYIGCTVDPEWISFSVFRAWMLTQDWEGNQLDKDILIQGNKAYSPESCVFIPSQINTFLNDCGASRGDWPIGVYRDKRLGKFRSSCNNPFTRNEEYLGLFASPMAAHEAWRARKYELACQYADMQKDPRIAHALRTRYAKGECK